MLDSIKLRQIYLALVETIITCAIVGWVGAFNNFNIITSMPKSDLKNDFSKTLRCHTVTLYKDFKLLFVKKFTLNQSLYF